MRGALMTEVGLDEVEVIDDLETVAVGPGQVRVKIEATGVCHSDLSGMKGIIPGMTPQILGHEGAGIIEEIGEGVDRVAVGDHVIVAWSPPCGKCSMCVKHRSPHLCVMIQFAASGTPNFSRGGNPVWGFAGVGTFAEQVVIAQEAVVVIGSDVPLDIASLIGCGVTTGVGAAINTATVTPGSNVVVFGCGGVGMSVIQGARIAGAAEIVAVDLNEAKLADAKRLGASHATTPDGLAALQAEITGGDGFDFAFEAIGVPAVMRQAYDAIRRGGTCCIVGVGKADQFLQISAFELFFNEKTLIGSYYGSADVNVDFAKLLRLWKNGRLDLEGMITSRIGIDDVNDALHAVERGEAIRQVITF
jgi:S-(hydroxymethyl)glutathione dehydrogenase/alcohol dehydrogenase